MARRLMLLVVCLLLVGCGAQGGLTEAEQNYVTVMTPIDAELLQAMQDFDGHNVLLADDPTLMTEEGWLNDLVTIVVRISASADQALAQDAPPRLAAYHTRYEEAATLSKEFVDGLVLGMEGMDNTQIQESIGLLYEARAILDEIGSPEQAGLAIENTE